MNASIAPARASRHSINPPPLALQLQQIETELGKQEVALRKVKAESQDAELQLRSLKESGRRIGRS